MEKKMVKNPKLVNTKVNREEICKKMRKFRRMEGEVRLLKLGYEDAQNVRERREEKVKLKEIQSESKEYKGTNLMKNE